jgi:hypothetical protein
VSTIHAVLEAASGSPGPTLALVDAITRCNVRVSFRVSPRGFVTCELDGRSMRWCRVEFTAFAIEDALRGAATQLLGQLPERR